MSFFETVEQHPYRYDLPKILFALARIYKPQVVVEVGTHTGFTACWLARALQENNFGRLYCIDNFCWVKEPQREQWEYWTRECGVRDWIDLIVGRSQEVEWPNYLDMVFIDGNHTYEVAKWDLYRAVEGGATIIALHDTVSWEGSRRLAEETRRAKDWKAWDKLELYPQEGMLILMKHGPKPPCKGEDIGEKWDASA